MKKAEPAQQEDTTYKLEIERTPQTESVQLN